MFPKRKQLFCLRGIEFRFFGVQFGKGPGFLQSLFGAPKDTLLKICEAAGGKCYESENEIELADTFGKLISIYTFFFLYFCVSI